jgi:circadian clock protein KaiC
LIPATLDNDTLDYVPSGLPSMDPLIGGGLISSSVTLIAGPSGSGKTSIGLQFLAQSTPEEPGLHFGFYETPQRVRIKASALGQDFRAMEASGALTIVWNPTTAGLIDKLAFDLLRIVDEKNIKRVFLDSMGGMGRVAADKSRVLDLFTVLMGDLRGRGVTVVASWEVQSLLGSQIEAPAPDMSGLVDNLLLIRFDQHGAELKRVLSILKIRDSAYDPSLLEVVIGNQGIDVKKVFQHAIGD